ncbi:hypothetical protein PUNSTDRAFT_99756, partial [Punctularia strigosozonata HHB-11173 SS5]|uniref:uncharacterized protein n=1 Tax=Punctularia strigosozonata (strain HHB-11173) TaxID=741275 RepID=UPI00044178BA
MTSAPWQAAWDRAQPTLNTIRDSQSNPPSDGARILRVGQLDAELLDQELVQVLQQPLANALGLVNPTWKTRFTPELQLLLHLVLYKLSVWDTGASYGAKLQGLRYQPSDIRSPRTRLAHGALTVLLPYLHALLRARALSSAWPEAPASDPRRRAWDALSRAESAHALLALVNFVGFLWNGRYRTLADRLLRLRLVPAQRLVRRDVSYEFMNRQMVWHAFTEFLLFLLPLINLRLVRRRLTRLLAHTSSSLLSLLPTPIRAPTT